MHAAAGDGAGARALDDALRDRLTDLTVVTAARQSPFWARRLAPLDWRAGPVPAERLREVPPLDRDELIAGGASARSQVADWAFATYTSGTTGGAPLVLDRSRQEQRFVMRYFRALDALAEPTRARLVLALSSLYHGRQLQVPGRGHSFPLALSGEDACWRAAALLRRETVVDGQRRRITAVTGGLADIQLLTTWLQGAGQSDAASAITLVASTAYAMTRRQLERLRAFWDCRIDDRFSLAELFVSAIRCADCGLFHFDRYGVAEVVDDAGAPLETGRGRLLLTGFYPFGQMTPLIRYAPGDLADRRLVDCPRGRVGYRMLGREMGALRVELPGGGTHLLGELDIVEALEAVPTAARTEIPFMPPAFRDVGGPPLHRAAMRDGRATIEFELCFSPWVEPEHAEAARREAERALERAHPELGPALGHGTLSVAALPPGSLAGHPKYPRTPPEAPTGGRW